MGGVVFLIHESFRLAGRITRWSQSKNKSRYLEHGPNYEKTLFIDNILNMGRKGKNKKKEEEQEEEEEQKSGFIKKEETSQQPKAPKTPQKQPQKQPQKRANPPKPKEKSQPKPTKPTKEEKLHPNNQPTKKQKQEVPVKLQPSIINPPILQVPIPEEKPRKQEKPVEPSPEQLHPDLKIAQINHFYKSKGQIYFEVFLSNSQGQLLRQPQRLSFSQLRTTIENKQLLYLYLYNYCLQVSVHAAE